MIYPNGCTDGNNPMHMIGHHHEFIQCNLRKMLGYRTPAFFYDLTRCIQHHNPINNFPKQRHPVMGANGNKIGPSLWIIIPLQSNRFAAMDGWIVGANDYLPLRIIAIDQIDDDFHDGVFFLRFALGDQ